MAQVRYGNGRNPGHPFKDGVSVATHGRKKHRIRKQLARPLDPPVSYIKNGDWILKVSPDRAKQMMFYGKWKEATKADWDKMIGEYKKIDPEVEEMAEVFRNIV